MGRRHRRTVDVAKVQWMITNPIDKDSEDGEEQLVKVSGVSVSEEFVKIDGQPVIDLVKRGIK